MVWLERIEEKRVSGSNMKITSIKSSQTGSFSGEGQLEYLMLKNYLTKNQFTMRSLVIFARW